MADHWQMKRIHALVAAAHLVWLALLALAASASLTIPARLNPGDSYPIVFVTSSARDARSTDIADYDAFVDGVANAAGSLLQPLGATWQVIGSTLSVDAPTRIGGAFSVPVYGLSGLLVAK